MTNFNHRGLERKELVFFPKVINTADNSEIGRIVDLTVEGFLVITDNEIQPKTLLDIRIEWTDEFDKEAKLSCQVVVRWCKDDVNPDNKALGLHIEKISPEDKESIKRIMRKWGFPSWQ